MAQHDMNIANQGFPATRADINNALQALVSNSSGTSAPSTTFANQWWYDTTNNKLYIRNEANNAWIQVAVLDQTNNEWQITTGQISAADGDGLVFKTDDGNTRVTLSDGGDVTFADGTDIITASAGTDNVRIGEGAGDSIASGGNYNTVVGKDAGTSLTTGDNNVAIGFEALKTEDGHGSNVAVGYQALKTLNAGANAGNTAIGYQAGLDLTDGHSSTLAGTLAGQNLTTGDYNSFYGYNSGGDMTTGNKNVILGGFSGNAHGFDMRTTDSASVISDGGGQLQAIFNATTQVCLKLGRVTSDGYTYHPMIVAATESLSSSFTASAGVAQSVTAGYVMPYQKQFMLHVNAGASAYQNHVTYMITTNFSNVTATTLASVFNGSGNLTLNSIGISFTGSYNSRKVVVTLTPSSGTALSNIDCVLHYAPALDSNSTSLYF